MEKICKIHGATGFSKKGKYYRCKKCDVIAVSNRRRKLKQLAVIYKGNKCESCGYDKCIDALDFHHKNPDDKEFNIASGNTKSWDKIRNEVDKCTLLCANCHREIHSNMGS